MPRIDPAQLLNCLQVLLSPTGGILSEEEVHRLASLMTKFSKKLVSKCVYVLILKNTEKRLLNLFMGCGGWTLVQLWLHDAMYSSNWVLVKELLELLILTPVDVERLKSNNIPKLVKSLSKREDVEGVCRLASQLVQQWLKIVKDETQSEQQRLVQAVAATPPIVVEKPKESIPNEHNASNSNHEHSDSGVSTKSFYKLSLKESKQAIPKVHLEPDVIAEDAEAINDEDISKEKIKDDKKKPSEKNKHRSSSSSGSKSSKDSHKNRLSSSSKDRDKSKDKSKHHSSSRDKDKDRHRSNGSVTSNDSSSSKSSKHSSSRKDKDRKDPKETQEKQIEKDRDTLHQIQPQSIHKLPKIPKKSSDVKNKDVKSEGQKGSISIEIRKNAEERPKTVKVYKSKMRSTGLEEESKPAPPRITKKPPVLPPTPLPTVSPMKRSSPVRDVSGLPPEKKTKIDVPVERPGAIKLIPPKPKPAVLQESDMFMDALTAATTKKEPKKRKRRISSSKDAGSTSPPRSPTSPSIKNISPPKFYQDTLQTDETKVETDAKGDADEVAAETSEEPARSSTPVDITAEEKSASEVHLNASGLKSVLVYAKRKGPKKTISWKADDELVDVRYFELDESERVNVTRAFGDMAKMDVRGEREAIQMSRKLQNEDVMESQTVWKVPTEIDLPAALVIPGCKSFERDIQFAREKSTMQALYFNKRMLPDSPGEPDVENYQIKDPIPIPVDDAENPDHDFRNTPWPDPKGSPPRTPILNNVPPMFQNPTQPKFQNVPAAPPMHFPNLSTNIKPNVVPPLQFHNPQPNFLPQPQNIMGPEWNAMNIPPNMPMVQPNIPPPEMMNQGPPMNPMFFPTPEHFNPGGNEVNHRFPGPFNTQGPPPGMFPQNNFNHNQHNPNRGGHMRGRGNNFGSFRRGGTGMVNNSGSVWMRMNGPPQTKWHKNPRGPPRRGGGGRGGGNYNRGYTGNADMY